MSARIYIDLNAIHPVIGNIWHRIQLPGYPTPGEQITMLCGASAEAEFDRLENRRAHGTPTTCWACDYLYRRNNNIEIPKDHPGIPSPRAR